MEYCDNGTDLLKPWVDGGLSRCFYSTVSSAVISGFLFIFGSVQLILYKKYSCQVDRLMRPNAPLYKLQIVVHLILALESIVHLILQGTVIGDKQVYGYQIMDGCSGAMVWLFAVGLMHLERHRRLWGFLAAGHGPVILIFWTLAFVRENLGFISWFSPQWWWQIKSKSDDIELSLWIVKFVCTLVLFVLGFKAPGLVPSESAYREFIINDGTDEEQQTQSQTSPGSTWKGFFKKLKKMWPYMWPKSKPLLQVLVLACVLVLVGGRVVNLYVPLYYKSIVNSLTINPKMDLQNPKTLRDVIPLQFRWDLILIYVGLRFLQGGGSGGGILSNTRSFLWIRVRQYTSMQTRVQLLGHIHALSLRWHLARKTGEVLRITDRGTGSINTLLSILLFNIGPTIADIVIAIVYFFSAFGAWFALIVFATMCLYLACTIAITEWRTKFRRQMNELDNKKNAKAVDSLLNFETVKYYGAEDYEVEQYRDAIAKYQEREWVSNATMIMLNLVQGTVLNGGLLAGSLLCAWYVTSGKGFTVGDYVLFATYITQLYGPINYLGSQYRAIQQAFIDMENMFDLFDEKLEIKDPPNAPDLQVKEGQIEFNNVTFHYEPRKTILKNISFKVAPGQTFALVGPSGSGKSTIIRLLFRFYDVQEGDIKLDGQNLTLVKQSSVRQSIGVVPQDTVLFNNDIRYNIRYGRVTAEDEQVEEAARAADIHHRIESFPDGYDTVVGERGLKLSGGEKQRVAIARTILKAPMFILLDEATSALDTKTERNIQASLAKICENKTSLIVAHRLSTIIHADQILVLKNGEIVERGRHEELLAIEDGVYADMWHQQQTAASENGFTDSEDFTNMLPPGGTKRHPGEPQDDKLIQL